MRMATFNITISEEVKLFIKELANEMSVSASSLIETEFRNKLKLKSLKEGKHDENELSEKQEKQIERIKMLNGFFSTSGDIDYEKAKFNYINNKYLK